MLKKLVMLALFTTAIVAGTGLFGRRAVTQEIDTSTLDGMAAQAIARGQSEVFLSNHEFYDSVDSVTTALSRYTVLEATPIGKTSYVMDEFSIGTWYRFRINRTLKQNPLPTCGDCTPVPDPPADLPAANWDEFFVLHGGGIQLVNGVTFYITVPDFPDFTLHQKYLLFVDYDPTKKVGLVSVGPPGAYMVDGYGNLSHVYTSEDNDTIGTGLAASYGNNANTLYNALNPPPPPPECNYWEEQDCWNRGGTWDSWSCYCNEPNPCGGYGNYMWNCY